MTRAEDQKNLQADIPGELHDRLVRWIEDHNNVKLRQCVQAMTELWLLLPEHLQAILLISKPESNPFCWVAEYTGRNLMLAEDAFEIRSEIAPFAVRHLLYILQDYAETRTAVPTNDALGLVLRTFGELLKWYGPRFEPGLSDIDRETVEAIMASIERWDGAEHSIVSPLQAVRGIIRAIRPDTIRLLSEREQREVDEIRRLLGPEAPTKAKKEG